MAATSLLEEEYCQLHLSQLQSFEESWNTLLPSSKEFLQQLNLPMVNPFCNEYYHVNDNDSTMTMIASSSSYPWMMMDNMTVPTTSFATAPSMGSVSMIPTVLDFQNEPIGSLITFCYMTLPAIVGLICLWIRLLSAYIAPIGVLYLLRWKYNDYFCFGRLGLQPLKHYAPASPPPKRRYMIATVVSSLIIMVDAQYVLEYDHPYYGIFLFVTSCNLVLSICRNNGNIHHKNHHRASKHFRVTRLIVEILIMVALYLTVDDIKTMKYHFGHVGDDVPTVSEGIYYDTTNPFMEKVVQDNPTWPAESRVYDYQHGATPWMVTGDSRTGLPYLFNDVPTPKYHRVWLPTTSEEDDDNEYLALDISFPTNGNGHDPTKPLYLIFHGLNGGSNDGYVQDITVRRNQEGSTVVVMIARGIMDTPIRGWTVRTER